MQKVLAILYIIFFVQVLHAQERVNPVISEYGGIYDIPDAKVKVDPAIDYNIVIDVYSSIDEPQLLNPALNNVARMLNLHSVSGADVGKMHVVLAVHAGATYALMDDESYREKYRMANPNTQLVKQLVASGVDVTVCGQSLISRKVDPDGLLPGVQIATSMLTTVTTFQLKGYAFLRF